MFIAFVLVKPTEGAGCVSQLRRAAVSLARLGLVELRLGGIARDHLLVSLCQLLALHFETFLCGVYFVFNFHLGFGQINKH